MISLAAKRTTTMSRHHQMLRKTVGNTAKLSARQQQQQQRVRLATTVASSTTKQQQPIVISRRAWIDFKKSRGITKRKPDASKGPKSDDEKPWPRNMQIAGYVAGAVAVPYVILWTITSNPTLREWFGPYIPLDKLRTYYGQLEWDAQNYSEELEYVENREKNGNNQSESLIGYYQFPEEAPFHERRQQEIIEAMNESDVDTTLSLASSSLSSEDVVTKKIPAKIVANAKNLLQYFPSASTSTDGNAAVAIDFLDRTDEDNDNNLDTTGGNNISDAHSKSLNDGSLMTDADSLANNTKGNGQEGSRDLTLVSRQLAKDVQTASIWTYIPQASGEGSNNGANNASKVPRLTDIEMEMGRLEYTISELENNLKDPMCTRSIDDVMIELRQAKRDLSKLTWKKRFGFSHKA